jgi:molecular chaperone GrpE
MFKNDKKTDENGNPFDEEIITSETEENISEEAKTECSKENSELQSQFDKLKEEKQTLDSQYVRLAADFDNYRKRQEQERESLLKYGAEETLKKLLPVVDNFERAEKSLKDITDPEKLKESFEAVYKQFMDAFEKIGVQKIETAGQTFDPNFHEAVMQTPSSEYPDQTIINELQSGYKLSDRVLRPTLVNVAVSE